MAADCVAGVGAFGPTGVSCAARENLEIVITSETLNRTRYGLANTKTSCELLPLRREALRGRTAKSLYPSDRQPISTAGSENSLLPCQSDAYSFLRRDEVIEALSILGNGELYSLDGACKFISPRSVVR